MSKIEFFCSFRHNFAFFKGFYRNREKVSKNATILRNLHFFYFSAQIRVFHVFSPKNAVFHVFQNKIQKLYFFACFVIILRFLKVFIEIELEWAKTWKLYKKWIFFSPKNAFFTFLPLNTAFFTFFIKKNWEWSIIVFFRSFRHYFAFFKGFHRNWVGVRKKVKIIKNPNFFIFLPTNAFFTFLARKTQFSTFFQTKIRNRQKLWFFARFVIILRSSKVFIEIKLNWAKTWKLYKIWIFLFFRPKTRFSRF